MDTVAQINILISLAEEMGIEVRHASLGGNGGGLCTIRGERVLFVDTAADAATRLEQTTHALAQLPEIEARFVRPDLRELLESHRRRG